MMSMLARPAAARRAGCCLLLLGIAAAREHLEVDLTEPEPHERAQEDLRPGVPLLNRVTFGGNVLAEQGSEHVAQWLVYFCPSWWEPCQAMLEPFSQLATSWEGKLNTALLTREVRFAAVDCASDKVLCNEQGVESYPTVHYYQGGQIKSSWSGGRGKAKDAPQLEKWLARRLHRERPAERAPGSEASPLLGMLGKWLPSDSCLDLLLVLGVLALNCRAVCSNPQLWQKQPPVVERGCCCCGERKRSREEPPEAAKGPALPKEWIARPTIEL